MKEDTSENIYDAKLLKPRIMTEEEFLAMKENLALRNFGMSLDEFRKPYEAGEFDGDRERHGKVIGLAMMLPEYWAE